MTAGPDRPRARVAEVSPRGRGAIATLRVWGPDALYVASDVFRANKASWTLAETSAGRPRVGRIGVGIGDEVVATVISDDPPEVEIQCHGGASAVGMVFDALVALGADRASARDWARHSTGSPIRADASMALAGAETIRSAEILLDQAGGALDRGLEALLDAIDRDREMGTILAIVDGMIARGRVGARLSGGWRIALAGRPNVGKSRLLNALAGFDRSIVAAEAGTTRDVVSMNLAIDGWPVEVADTAGLREAEGEVEAEGVERARARHASSDLVVVLVDRSVPITPEDCAILAEHPQSIVVASKADLPAAWDESTLNTLAISAERGDGIDPLIALMVDRLGLVMPEAGSAVPFRAWHVRRLRAIRDRLRWGNVDRARRSLGRWLGAGRSSRLEGSP